MITPIKINPISNLKFRGISANQKTYPKEIRQNFSTTDGGVILSSQIGIIDPSDLRFEMFLNKKQRVTLDEYKSIKKNCPEIIQKAGYYSDKTAKSNKMTLTPELCAELVTGYLDIPRLPHKIISIGTSPSFITESLSQLGEDVVFIPISGVNLCKEKTTIHDYFQQYPNLKHVADYLIHKGITAKNLEDKDAILLDYKATGKTLNILKRLVCEYCKVPEENVRKMNIGNLIDSIYMSIKKPWEDGKDRKVLILDDIDKQKVEKISNVPHFIVCRDDLNENKIGCIAAKGRTQNELFKEFEEFSRPSARAYQLSIFNKLDISGKLK